MLILKNLPALQPYEAIWVQMRDFTHSRTPENPLVDEIWFLEHEPVYTQGQAGKPEHILANPAHIPIVQSDRGGQVTYHGPGQLMIYLLLNLKHYGFDAKSYVQFLEKAIITVLNQRYGITGFTQENAPGVYIHYPIAGACPLVKKIASIGIRVRKNFSYHGICLNISSDLTPFDNINPCGHSGLTMAQLSDFDQTKCLTVSQVKQDFTHYFQEVLKHV